MKDVDNKISDVLDLDPDNFEEVETNRNLPAIVTGKTDDQKQIEDDAEYARQNVYEVISRGSEALDEMLLVAHGAQSARSYEVVSTLLKTLLDANKDLLELQNKKLDLKKKAEESAPSPSGNITNNNLFVGSTADMLKIMKQGSNANSSTRD